MPPAAPVLGAHVRKSLEIAAVRPAFALGLRAATATIVMFSCTKLSGTNEFEAMLKSSTPAARSCAWLTCGPPGRRFTSRPYFL